MDYFSAAIFDYIPLYRIEKLQFAEDRDQLNGYDLCSWRQTAIYDHLVNKKIW